ncbi:F-box/WD repeat-containing protein 5-like [Oppia nitens]|uniref:F-box/WD repeat-containing protein 5-like n=1 Tax=Oppia nitens TaxID=1686743 RepID=UPI0023DB97F9|nr:F-box/WD repeat-containing protein 5-like [Oppia nitens]
MWSLLPEPLLLEIFKHLTVDQMLNVLLVCRQWSRVGSDDLLWKHFFYRRFDSIDRSVSLPIGSLGYRYECRRLIYHTPKFESETLEAHDHQVLHVSFAHSGRMFSSCSKDGFVMVWTTESWPTRLKYSADMKDYSWSYTQFSQFNQDDSLLLVSGVHFGPHTASGEIAVFNLGADNFQLQCRVLNKPYDVFGTWYTNDYLISSRLHFLGNLVSCSALWLNKACQETESERKPIIKRLFKFYNKNASSVRSVLVADCIADDDGGGGQGSAAKAEDEDNCSSNCCSRGGGQSHHNHQCMGSAHRGNPVSSLGTNRLLKSLQTPPNYSHRIDYFGADSNISCTNESPIRYNAEYHRCQQHQQQQHHHQQQQQLQTNQRHGDSSLSRTISNDSDGSTNSDFDDPPLPWDEDWLKLSDDDNNEADDDEEEEEEEFATDGNGGGGGGNSRKVNRNNNNIQKTSQTNGLKSNKTQSMDSSSRAVGGGGQSSHYGHNNNNYTKQPPNNSRLLCNTDKLLIFTCGSQTYAPHQIGIKRIKPIKFDEYVMETATLSKRLEERRQEQELQALVPSPNWLEEQSVAHYFDSIDHVIDLKGHIIGMGLSPDHRYLYVNSRSWPVNANVDNPLEPPPIAQQIDIHVYDLRTFKKVGNMFRSHRAYTPNDECFFIFLDVSDQFVASGAEDNQGYIWDRHYGLCLARLPHKDVVNSVAFNPRNPEMVVTASDDKTLKVWRSSNQMKLIS